MSKMTPPIAYDMTRLCYAPSMPTPRGIDRIEFGIADFFFREWPGECVAILPTPWGVRCFDRDFGCTLLDLLAGKWKETSKAFEDPAFAFVKTALHDARNMRRYYSSESISPVWQSVLGRIYDVNKHLGFNLGANAVRSTPLGAVYLNLGHSGLAVGLLLKWLKFRTDVLPVFMIHDTIPLEHPEFVTPNAGLLFKEMITNAKNHAHALIVTTESAKRSILHAIGEGVPPPERIFACRLPVNDVFFRRRRHAESDERSYFVFCGSVEPRKNLALLLSIWNKIVRLRGSTAPALVVVGTRTTRIRETAAMLDRCTNLNGHLIEVEGLSTDGLQTLMAGARALLMPSFAEGFGIPIAEALASGTPVIASDIDAHKEAGGDAVDYIDPTNGPAWMSAILSLHDHPRMAPAAEIQDWPGYISDLVDFINALSNQPAINKRKLPSLVAAEI